MKKDKKQTLRDVMQPHTTGGNSRYAAERAEERYRKRLADLKKEQEKENSPLITEPSWPNFKEHDYNSLVRIGYKLAEFLDKNDIPFDGIAFDKHKDTGKPVFMLHMDRSTRGLDFAVDLPEEFNGFQIQKIISNKFNFKLK